MIDLKTLAEGERNLLDEAKKHPDAKRLLMDEVELLRLAMRYLAMREREVASIAAAIERGECEYISGDGVREQLDAAADRLIQEILK